MEAKKNEVLVQFNGRVPESLKNAFWDTVPKGTLNQHVMTASARLWISLPAELRKKLIDAESEDAKGRDNVFVKAVREIAREELQKLSQKKK